jgi:hypothetical protein
VPERLTALRPDALEGSTVDDCHHRDIPRHPRLVHPLSSCSAPDLVREHRRPSSDNFDHDAASGQKLDDNHSPGVLANDGRDRPKAHDHHDISDEGLAATVLLDHSGVVAGNHRSIDHEHLDDGILDHDDELRGLALFRLCARQVSGSQAAMAVKSTAGTPATTVSASWATSVCSSDRISHDHMKKLIGYSR